MIYLTVLAVVSRRICMTVRLMFWVGQVFNIKHAVHFLQHWLTWIVIALFSGTYGSHTFDICWMCWMCCLVRRWKCLHFDRHPWPMNRSKSHSLYSGCKPFTRDQWFLYPVHFSMPSCSSFRLMVAFLISCIVIAYSLCITDMLFTDF